MVRVGNWAKQQAQDFENNENRRYEQGSTEASNGVLECENHGLVYTINPMALSEKSGSIETLFAK